MGTLVGLGVGSDDVQCELLVDVLAVSSLVPKNTASSQSPLPRIPRDGVGEAVAWSRLPEQEVDAAVDTLLLTGDALRVAGGRDLPVGVHRRRGGRPEVRIGRVVRLSLAWRRWMGTRFG